MDYEVKSVDVSSTLAVDTTGGIAIINPLTRGYDISNRIGHSIHMVGLELRAAVTSSANAIDQTGRLIIIYDRLAKATTPALSDVLASSTSISPINSFNLWRFEIIYDELYAIRDHGIEFKQPFFDETITLDHCSKFNTSDAGTSADFVSGALYIVSIGNVAAGANTATLNYYTRVYFKDY